MKHFYFIVVFFVSYFSYCQSEINNVFAISTNYFGSNSKINEKDSLFIIYDKQGKILEEKYFDVDDSIQLSFTKKYIYNQKKLVQTLDLLWDKKHSFWDTISKRDFIYALNDSIHYKLWSKKSNQKWCVYTKSEVQFDEQNRVASEVISNLDVTENKFLPTQKNIFQYNNCNQIEIITRQVYNKKADWINTGKDSIGYENGNKIQKFSFYYDDYKGGAWLKTSKETNSYNVYDKHYQTLIQHWSPEQNDYVTNEYTRLITSHYKNQRLSFISEQLFDVNLNKFVDFEHKFFY